MEKTCTYKNKQIEDLIKDLRKDLKTYKELKDKPIFNIFLENVYENDIKNYLNRITNLLKINLNLINIYNNHDKDIFDYSNKNIKNSIIIIDVNEDNNRFYSDFRKKEVAKAISIINSKNNIILFYTNNFFNNYEFFNKSLLHKSSKYNTCNRNINDMYNILNKKFENNNISSSVTFDTYKKIYDRFKSDEIYKTYNTNDFIYNTVICNMNNNSIDEGTFLSKFNEFLPPTEKETKELINDIENEERNNIKVNDSFVGLNSIKSEINTLLKYAEYLKTSNSNKGTYLNMFFLGNPGTGKTMIADYIKDMLFKMSYIKENKIVKVVPNDLVAEYVGQTRNQARKVLNSAKNGLLFIDEAYLLLNDNYSRDRNNPFMQEAIIELMKYMEDPTNIVIFAGYKDELRKIYKVNKGLKSRIYKEIEFPDYSTQELLTILNKDLKTKGFKINSTSRKSIISHIENMKKEKDFGNARSILKLSQELIINHINNGSDSKLIDTSDIPKLNNQNRKVGLLNYVK